MADKPLMRQARLKDHSPAFGGWASYGNVGLIDAAILHAESLGLKNPEVTILVRDIEEPENILECVLRLKPSKYICINPRGGA